jgi:diguanylate cyclase (GGDEF)-like protein
MLRGLFLGSVTREGDLSKRLLTNFLVRLIFTHRLNRYFSTVWHQFPMGSTRKKILAKAGMTTLLAIIVTYSISFSSRAAFGMPIDALILVNCALIPTVICMPVGGFIFWQGEKLAAAHRALTLAHAELAERSRIDQMTGTLNRETFLETLETMRRRTDTGTLLIIDADNFKKINDSYGHLRGDQALLKISRAICRAVRQEDIVGRIGGEEFGAILMGAGSDEAAHVAERIREEVENAALALAEGKTHTLTVSIGGTTGMFSEASISDLMRKADACLYAAKRLGRNRVILDSAFPIAA